MSSFAKFGFRIRTQNGLVVDKLTIQGRNEADAERKLRQMYRNCEVLACTASTRSSETAQLRFMDVASLLAK